MSCDFETPWYLRFYVKDQPGIIASLAAILSAHQLNIDSVLQKPGFEKNSLPFVITLEPCRDAQLHPALEQMSSLEFCTKPCLCLPACASLCQERNRKKKSSNKKTRRLYHSGEPYLSEQAPGISIPEGIFQTGGRQRLVGRRFGAGRV